MLNDSTQTPALGLFKSNSLTPGTKFDLTMPAKIVQLDYNEASFKKILNQDKLVFEFSNPIKIAMKIDLDKVGKNPAPRTHVILVDQAPYSVFKSVKSQERTLQEQPGSKLVVLNSNRSHPYNNSIRPSDLRNAPQADKLKQMELTVEPTGDKAGSITDEPAQTSESSVPQAGTKISRNCSSNAVLAQLKSIGPSFRSIFVRPKNTKHIDLSNFSALTGGLAKKNSSKAATFDYKELLKQSYMAKSLDNPLDEHIIRTLPMPTELKVNQSVDDYFKLSNTQENYSLNKESYSKKESHIDHLPQTEKWTCMVCLSKHLKKVDICSICGSSRPKLVPNNCSKNISFSKPVSKTSPRCSLIDRQSIDSKPHKSDEIISLLENDDYYYKKFMFTPKPNPYIKKWTCQHCNYSNDSLKIVCINCRWVKTAPVKTKQGINLNETIKPSSISQLISSTEWESPIKKSKSSEEPEGQKESLASIFSKTNTNNWSCPTCLVSNDQFSSKCVSCGEAKSGKKEENKPKESEGQKESPASIFSKTNTNNWSCPTCLVSNDQFSNKCVSCGEAKSGKKEEDKSKDIVGSKFVPGMISFGSSSSESSASKPSFKSTFGATNLGVSAGFSFKPFAETKVPPESKNVEKDKEANTEQSLFKFVPFDKKKSEDTQILLSKANDKSTTFSPFSQSGDSTPKRDSTTLSNKDVPQSSDFSFGNKSSSFQANSISFKTTTDSFGKDLNSNSSQLFGLSQSTKLPQDKTNETSTSLFGKDQNITSSQLFGSSQSTKLPQDNTKETFKSINSSSLFSNTLPSQIPNSISQSNQTFAPSGFQLSGTNLNTNVQQNENKDSNSKLFGTSSLAFGSDKKVDLYGKVGSNETSFNSSVKETTPKMTTGIFGQELNTSVSGAEGVKSFINGGNASDSAKPATNQFGLENNDKKETNVFPSFGTLNSNNTSTPLGSVSATGLFGAQNLENKPTISFGSTGGLFSSSANAASSPFGSVAKSSETISSAPSNQISFGLMTKPVQENGNISNQQQTGLFGPNSSPFGQIKPDDKTSLFKIGDNKNSTDSPFANQSTTNQSNPFNFASTPTSNKSNLSPFGSTVSTNTTLFPTPDVSKQKNSLFGSESTGKRPFFGDTSPNISFQSDITPSNSNKPAFGFSNQNNFGLNGQANNQGFNFDNSQQLSFNFGVSNSNDIIQFTGSNEQPRGVETRRVAKGRRRLR